MKYHVELWGKILAVRQGAQDINESLRTSELFVVIDSDGDEWGIGSKEVCERLCATLNSIKNGALTP